MYGEGGVWSDVTGAGASRMMQAATSGFRGCPTRASAESAGALPADTAGNGGGDSSPSQRPQAHGHTPAAPVAEAGRNDRPRSSARRPRVRGIEPIAMNQCLPSSSPASCHFFRQTLTCRKRIACPYTMPKFARLTTDWTPERGNDYRCSCRRSAFCSMERPKRSCVAGRPP
jgi:hypothetical protein